MQISGDMLKSIDEVLFTYATMTPIQRQGEFGTLAKLAIVKFASEGTKQRLREWIQQLKPSGPKQRKATEIPLIVIATSKTGHSRSEGAEGPGVVCEV